MQTPGRDLESSGKCILSSLSVTVPDCDVLMQKFRHVDNIFIENEEVVNRFLDFWRRTGQQRLGFLIGRYEPFPDVPLGIKAVVAAIYEPPQVGMNDLIE